MNDRIDTETGEVHDDSGGSLEVVELTALGMLNKGEIDVQIATAHKYPRTLRDVRERAMALCTMSDEVAGECTYTLGRGKKTIVGPSARFAEMLAYSWRNCRAGANIIDDKGTYIVAQGRFIDLEANVGFQAEVMRRVTDKSGRRYNDDMLVVTGNAACSIALRNAILKGIPKALWGSIWDASRKAALGDATTFANKRLKVIERLNKMGVSSDMIFERLGRSTVDEITHDDVALLIGAGTAIKDNDSTIDELFGKEETTTAEHAPTTGAGQQLKERLEKSIEAARKKKESEASAAPTEAELMARIAGCLTVDDVAATLGASNHLTDDARARIKARAAEREDELGAGQ